MLALLLSVHIFMERRGRMKWEKIRTEHVAESARPACSTETLCFWRFFCYLAERRRDPMNMGSWKGGENSWCSQFSRMAFFFNGDSMGTNEFVFGMTNHAHRGWPIFSTIEIWDDPPNRRADVPGFVAVVMTDLVIVHSSAKGTLVGGEPWYAGHDKSTTEFYNCPGPSIFGCVKSICFGTSLLVVSQSMMLVILRDFFYVPYTCDAR